jgi:flagellar basal-body rod modification protein FlgD
MVNGISSVKDAAASNTATPSQTATQGDALASKDTFLKLLVAQIRNQDPLQPSDGIQFVTQLAQYSSLEQTMELRKDVESIQELLQKQAAGSNQNSGDTQKS